MSEIINKDARSPYQRYGKTPYRYSEHYRKWHNAFKTGDQREMRKSHDNWCKRYAPVEMRYGKRGAPIHEMMPEDLSDEA